MTNSTEACATRAITVPFNGAELYVVEHNGQPYTPMKPIVESMGLTWHGQHRKLMQGYSRDENTSGRWGMVIMTIPLHSGAQEMLTMPLRKLPGWMATLEPSRIKNEDVRTRVIQYQNECDDALWQYWNDGIAINPRAARPHNPALDYDRISPAQAQDLKELVHSVVDAKVQGFPETWARLYKKFRVNSYLELPATRFNEARDYLLGKLPPEATAAQSEPSQTLTAQRNRRWLLEDTGTGAPKVTELAPDAQFISQSDIARQAHAAKVAQLESAIAENEKQACDHRATLFIYEKNTKPGDRAKWLAHQASAAQADWHAEDFRNQLRSLGIPQAQ